MSKRVCSYIVEQVLYYLAIWFDLAIILNSEKQIYSYEANSLGVVSCSYNEQTNRLLVYSRLLTNRLHGKAAELCLANS